MPKRHRLLNLSIGALAVSAACSIWPASGHARARLADGPGSVLRIADEGTRDVATIDPIFNQSYASNLPIDLLFSGLVKLTVNPDGTYGKIVPDAAASYTLAPDGATYTFHLRPGLRFSDGNPVTAADFVYSMTRALNPKNVGAASYFLLPVKGAYAYYTGKATSVTGLQAPDPQTVQITLAAPTAYFLDALSWSTSYVVERSVVERYGAQWSDHAVGTGPFMLKSFTHSQGLVLVPNPYWYGPHPTLKEVDIPFILNTDTAYNAYQTGTIDVMGVGAQSFPAARFADAIKRPDFHIAPTLATDYIDLSQRKGSVFANIHVRRAFSLAINKDIVALVLGKSVLPTDGYLTAGVPGFNPRFKGLHYDQAAARRELALAGYPGGKGFPTLSFIYYTGSAAVDNEAQALQLMWQDVLGVQVRIKPTDLQVLINAQISRAFDLALSENFATYPDPHAFLFALQSSSGLWSNPQFDALTNKADAITGNDALRYRLYQQAESVAAEQAPWIPLDVVRQGVLIAGRIHGLTATAYGVSVADWSRVSAS